MYFQEQPVQQENATSKFILVVEDDLDIGRLLVQVLTLETSYRATLFSDGFTALKAIANLKPNLCILDYQIPRMNGLELYDRIHAMEELKDVPVIMMSAQLPQREVEKRNIIGIHKPIDLNDFLNIVEKLLN